MSDYFNNDNRICKVLQILEHKRSASLEYLEKKLNVSTKSIKNDIKELNEIFDGNALIQFKLGKYKLYVLEYKQFEKIKENLYLHDDFFNSPKKRMAYVINRLMNDENPVLTEDLAFEMSIGRTTLVGDLKKIREALEKYMAEKIVFFQAGANFLTMIKENAPSTYANTDVAPQIVGELAQNDFSLMNFVIPVRAKHKAEALKFALFLTNYENQLEMAKLTNILAVNQKALEDGFYTSYDKNDLISKARVISAKQLYKIEPVFTPARNQKEINTVVNTAVQQILLDKNTTKSILDDVQGKIDMLGE